MLDVWCEPTPISDLATAFLSRGGGAGAVLVVVRQPASASGGRRCRWFGS